MRVVGVVRVVVHGVVYVDAFVVEKLGERDHGCVVEVLAKTTGHQMYVDPLRVLKGQGRLLEEDWVSSEDCDEFLLLFQHSESLLQDRVFTQGSYRISSSFSYQKAA